ncbi:hypothetical protein HBN76_04560 [Pseudomonas sp. WS 5013]|uniref:phage tail protein n=1 Tax=Pseudomonas sp. WS 5013 TaxID=2717475 RepID=UPI001473B292|nr:phage tail protein [Pseudomonas sp. WS 5013]NMY40570.1 hypothetical protein [Pseudomonas sp. WS 5013]
MSSGGNDEVTVGFEYYFDIHMGLGLPIDELVAIKAGGKEAWRGSISNNGEIQIDKAELFGGESGEGGIKGDLYVMFGEETQTVYSRLASLLGGLVPAFRGISTAFFSGMVTAINPYPKPWEFLRRGGNRLWDGEGAWYPSKQFIWLASNQIKAMNPAHILYLMYTGTRFRGLNRARMDDAAWRAAADRLYSEELGLCLEWRRSDSFKNFRDSVLAHISAEIYMDRRTGLISIRLLRDDYDVNSLPLFDEDSGLLEIVEDEIPSQTSVPSQLIVNYVDAITGDKRSVRAVNAAVAARDLGRSSESVDYPGAPTGGIAARLAQRDLRIRTSGLKRFKVVLDRRGRNLSPGQPFRLRSLKRGIDQVVVRGSRIEDGTLVDGKISITALQDVFGLPATSFVAVPPEGWLPPDRAPYAITERRIFEVPYRELALRLDPANLDLVDPTAAYVAAVALAPTSMSLDYTLTDRVGGSGNFITRKSGDWCPSGLLVGALNKVATSISLTSTSRLDDVEVGMVGMLDQEMIRVDAINYSTGVLTIGRGCLDSVPEDHAVGARLWFYDGYTGRDETAYSIGTGLQVKLLTRTSQGKLASGLASTDSISLQGRQGRPYPPGLFRVGGAAYPAQIVGTVTVTWSHRDRLQQADQVIDTTLGNIGPEPGTTYTCRLIRADNSVQLAISTGITGTTVSLPTSYMGMVIVELWSSRGGLDSLQRHRHTFEHLAGEPLLTESTEDLLTETAELLTSEC